MSQVFTLFNFLFVYSNEFFEEKIKVDFTIRVDYKIFFDHINILSIYN